MAYLPPMNGGRLNASISSAAGGSVLGASLISTGTMNLVAGSNITLSQAGGNISFQAPNAHNVSFGGNMAGAAAMVSTGTLSLYGGNNITLSQNANNVTINGPTAGGGSINFSAGTTSSNLASVRFADSNGVGFGLNGSVITASYTQQPMFDAGVSTMGNTAGVTGTNTNGLFLAGSNNITLSQSTNANGATVSIVGPTFTSANNVSLGINNGTVTASASFNQTQQTANIIQGAAVVGSTLTSGSLLFSNTPGFTFGLNGSVLTATAAPDGIQAISASNGSAGSGTVMFSSANNINFGINAGTVTASYAGAAGGVAVGAGGATFATGTLGLNAAGAISFSTAAQSLTISAPATSSLTGSNITISTSNGSIGLIAQPMFDAGVSNLGNFAGTQTNVTGITNGLAFVGGNNVTLSQSSSSNGFATISINAGAAVSSFYGVNDISVSTNGNSVSISNLDPIGSYYDNLIQGMGTNATATSGQQAIAYAALSSNNTHVGHNRLLVQPLDPANDFFPFNMSIGTMMMNFSNSFTSTGTGASAAHSSSYYFGLYTRVNSTQLSLVNSVQVTLGMTANTANTVSYNGARWLTINSSQFSSAPIMSANQRYYFAWMARTANSTYSNMSLGGLYYGQSVQRSGIMGVNPGNSSSNTSLYAWHPFMGVHSITTHTGLPVSLANSDINKASALANFIPHIVFNAGGGQMY